MSTPNPAEERFRRLFDRHHAVILAYARRRLPEQGEAEDVAAEALAIAWRKLAEIPSGFEAERAWLYAVARRVLANRRRAGERRGRLLGRLRRETPVASEAGALRSREELRALLRALSELSEREREVLLLAAWEGLGTSEIAQVLACSENAIALRLHRARRKLASRLAKETGRCEQEKGACPGALTE